MPAGAAELQAVRRCYARHNAGDSAPWVELFDPDIRMRSHGVESFEDGAWLGRDEVARRFAGLFESLGPFRFFVHEVALLGDWVLADVTVRGHGVPGGSDTALRSVALYRFRHHRAVEVVLVPTRAEAHAVLRAA